MPSAAVDFRAVCGCFLAVYINFMVKRAKLKVAMKIAIVSLKTRVDGDMLGLLLVYLFWGSLLLLIVQELCESRGGRPGLPVPESPYGLCGFKATLT